MGLENLSGVELGREVSEGHITPTEVIDFFAERIEKRNPGINAFVYTKFDDARAEAKKLEARMARGEDVGPLAGVPVGLKDFLPSKKGWTNSHGGVKSLIRVDEADSVFYDSAVRAGAIAVGKTNAPAFAFRGTCDNKLYGPTRNPFNTEYNSGGSSGGSAAAVADGLVPISEGSDGGGSIRIPSAWCSCFGFKASVGTIPSVCRPDGWMATHPYCFNGAITRTVLDSAVMMNYMAYHDPRDPLSLDRGKRDFTELMKKPIKGLKIAFTADFDIFTVDPEVAGIVEAAAHRLEEAGAIVEQVHFGFKHSQNDFANIWCRSICIDTAIDMELWKKEGFDLVRDHRDELPEEFIYWNEEALRSSIMDYRYFNELRTEILDEQENIFEKYDIIISPVTICPPVKNASDGNTRGPEMMNGQRIEPLIGFCETFFENFAGNPAASVPAGLTATGLPVGMQIIGKKFLDEDVFAAAHAFEEISPWNYDIPYGREIH
ncbi:aspartyl-tRNA(Asn)/glutamyl-tRNA(Gln) amidotransferase subunit A [Lachnospiraceae bacterium XPB1003]|nr:aspartyl-tRNA(Asn)/glutamyl-tRNA(Gln) amidotransferase subunit A [Lachnospiraceae bacterium XPB1003]